MALRVYALDDPALPSALAEGWVVVACDDDGTTLYAEHGTAAGSTGGVSTSSPSAVLVNLAQGRLLVGVRTDPDADVRLLEWAEPHRYDATAEGNSGVSYMGVVTTVLALFVGFGFAALPAAINAVLVVGLLACIAALTAYANAVGANERLKRSDVIRYMEVGNILSEFGGFKLLLLVAPAAIALQADQAAYALLVAAGSVLLNTLLQREGLDMTSRYFSGGVAKAALGTDAVVAATGVLAATTGWLALWCMLLGLYLVAWSALCWRRQEG